MPRHYNNENKPVNRAWEEETAQKLLMIRLKFQSEDGRVQDGPYSQRSIARQLGITATCLHNWEYGKNRPGSWFLWKKWARSLQTEFKISLSNTSDKSKEISEIIQRSFE